MTYPCDYDPDEDDFVDCGDTCWPDDMEGPCMTHPGYSDECVDVNGEIRPVRL